MAPEKKPKKPKEKKRSIDYPSRRKYRNVQIRDTFYELFQQLKTEDERSVQWLVGKACQLYLIQRGKLPDGKSPPA